MNGYSNQSIFSINLKSQPSKSHQRCSLPIIDHQLPTDFKLEFFSRIFRFANTTGHTLSQNPIPNKQTYSKKYSPKFSQEINLLLTVHKININSCPTHSKRYKALAILYLTTSSFRTSRKIRINFTLMI